MAAFYISLALALAGPPLAGPRAPALSRRSVFFGGVGALLAVVPTQRALAATLEAPPGLDSSARYLSRGGPGALPMLGSKETGVERLTAAREKLVELGRLASDEGGKLCGTELYDEARVLIDRGGGDIAMKSGPDAYSVINLKKTALRAPLIGASAECEEMQMRQFVQATITSIDEMIAIGKAPTRRGQYDF
ncbi:hypothetical protein T492DRAFT_1105545 [Pavlovales sp. CCMP2436]|nr:hypothetical protein T492DRAFT_1105545 [Pavlovales sp. CCMP2436]|mmetsp:Transcript_38204/g.94567  ORF Transcript_38204/g.94567 Transcript_38204/m.94567 type:complete len:192 (-) Transcript_38204:298-873(-)